MECLGLFSLTQKSGCKVDMWAAGVTLYCLAFSKTPFDGATVMEVFEQIRSQPRTSRLRVYLCRSLLSFVC